jgi:MFS family permease
MKPVSAPSNADQAVKLARRVARRLHRAASADGADRSGLAALLWTHALSSFGDTLVAVALASTAFFQVSASAARGKIALYLLLTLLPFSLLVPVAGPLLDRFPHGRRYVLALTTTGRGLVAWTLAGSLASLSLYPQALLILVLARAYGVAKSAAVVRCRPPELGLVASNARLNIAGIASSGAAAAVGVAVANTIGSSWVLRLSACVFLVAGAAALRLPARVDDKRVAAGRSERFSLKEAPRKVRHALAATVSLRALSGLLTLGLAILLKAHHAHAVVVGFVLGAAVLGGLLGTMLASRFSADRTARITSLALLAPSVACLAAAVGGTKTLQALAVGAVGLGASLGKYALDAALQSQVDASQIGSAFARSETVLQLGWAVGGAVGLAATFSDHIWTDQKGQGAIAFCFVLATSGAVAGLIGAARWSRRSAL